MHKYMTGVCLMALFVLASVPSRMLSIDTVYDTTLPMKEVV